MPNMEDNLFVAVNQRCSSMSCAVDVVYNEERGRHLVANRPIPAGAALIVEDPYSLTVEPTCWSFVCDTCIDTISGTPQKCDGCEMVVYCSKACKDQGQPRHRKFECGLKISNFPPGVVILGVRTLLNAPMDAILHIYDHLWDADAQKRLCRYGCDSEQSLNTKHELFLSLHGLLPAEIVLNQTTFEDKLPLYVPTVVSQLEERGYLELDSWPKDMDTATRRNVTERVLIENIMRQKRNRQGATTCPLYKTALSPENQKTLDNNGTVKASGMYPIVLLMNHSCRPNAFVSFERYGLSKTRATVAIKPGEEICQSYGPRFGEKPVEYRKQLLRKTYFFDCTCTACTDAESHRIERLQCCFQCHKCGSPVAPRDPACPSCNAPVVMPDEILDKFNNLLITILKQGRQGSPEQFTSLVELEKQLASKLHPHNRTLFMWREQMVELMLENGIFNTAVESLLFSMLSTVHAAYGTESLKTGAVLKQFIRYHGGNQHLPMCHASMQQLAKLYVRYFGKKVCERCTDQPQWRTIVQKLGDANQFGW